MRSDYRLWLERQKYDAGTITAQLHRVGRVEKHYGDLDAHEANDGLVSVLAALRYGMEDKRHNRPNPSKIPIDGDIRSNLASYKNAIALYRRFLGSEPIPIDGPARQATSVSNATQIVLRSEEELGQRIGLERDMQAALRLAIDQIEEGLEIIDEGSERSVDSGLIDITARDVSGAIVVIELKTGTAGQRAVAQILSYMGDITAEDAGAAVRGILIASGFDNKAQAAARMVPTLSLYSYGVKFRFSRLAD